MNMELNKAFAALLTAGIIACFTGVGARMLVHPEMSGHDAYAIEAAEDGAGGAVVAVATGPEPIADLMAGADIARGEKLFKVCAACHTVDKGGPHRVGPNLAGVVGRKPAAAAGFAYSDALQSKGGVWDIDALNAFLWKPKKAVPGTKMVYAGMKKPEDRAAMIKWLQQQK
ncbi:MAG: cytochrome c family protein [Alphaproteobacteria bacterium]|nr:cytochrome c family protein [Alphaproteobacteria bacterium]